MIEISNLSQLPNTGRVVLIILNGTRSPCRKFLGEMEQAIGLIENPNNPAGGSYFNIQFSNEMKEVFQISYLPCAIIMVDGVEKNRIVGHWTYHFEMENLIRKGFSL